MFRSKYNQNLLSALLAFGICLVAFTGTALADGQNCGTCTEEKAAVWSPETSYVEQVHNSGSSERNVSIAAVKKLMHKREKTKHVRYLVREKENGSPSTNCVDPTKMNWGFHAGDGFLNHGPEGQLHDTWIAGWEICDFHIVKKGGREWAVGEKKNCGNTPIWIPIHSKVSKPRVRVVEVRSYEAFWVRYTSPRHKKVENKSASETERVVHVPGHYSCAAGWELVGTICRHTSSPCCTPESPCCEPPPCSSCEPPPCTQCQEPPRVENVYKIQEVFTNENIEFCADVYAPPGDNLTILFVTEYGTFSPREIKVSSYGTVSHFCTRYKAPSEPVFDHVHVSVQDNTTGKHCVSPDQLVEVLKREENPS